MKQSPAIEVVAIQSMEYSLHKFVQLIMKQDDEMRHFATDILGNIYDPYSKDYYLPWCFLIIRKTK